MHGGYLSSYHIEVMALNHFGGDLSDIAWHVFKFFEHAKDRVNASMWYDVGYADDYMTIVDRAEASKRLGTAYSKGLSAWHFGYKGEIKQAIEAWRQIFGDKFPAYG